MYTGRSYRSTTPSPYGWLPVGHPNVSCMRASGAPSPVCELRWTLETVADVEAVAVHLLSTVAARPASVVVSALACNNSQ